MDGENNGKPYEQMDDLGRFSHIFGNTHMDLFCVLKNHLCASFDIAPGHHKGWRGEIGMFFVSGNF